MLAGEVAPALERGLGPIAISAADIDGAELTEHQQHFVEMIRRRIVGVDQQSDVEFMVAFVAVDHRKLAPVPLT